jgi:hypothetical protein
VAQAATVSTIDRRTRQRISHAAKLCQAAVRAQFEVELKSDGVLGSEVGTDVQITPDGTRVVYVSRDASGVSRT